MRSVEPLQEIVHATSAPHLVRADGILGARLVLKRGARLADRIATRDLIAVVVRGEGTFAGRGRRRVGVGDVLDIVSGRCHSIAAHADLEIVFIDCPGLVRALCPPARR